MSNNTIRMLWYPKLPLEQRLRLASWNMLPIMPKDDMQPMKEDIPQCICYRKRKTVCCTRCHHFIKGRLAVVCPAHSKDILLMDVRQCPYCLAPIEYLVETDLPWSEAVESEGGPIIDTDYDL